MKKIILAILMLVNLTTRAQNTQYDISKDPKNGEVTFKGPLTFDELDKEATFTWLKQGTDEYKPDERYTGLLKEKLQNCNMVVFLGTWCDDSHYLVPKFRKLLREIGFQESKITMYGVDREKTTKGGEERKYNITLVPTIIVFENGKEMGRITETVQKGLEADLASFFH